MIITRPTPDARVPLGKIDLTAPQLYTNGDPHRTWLTLRALCPVFWQSRQDGEGYWAVTRWADVRRVLTEHTSFTSEAGTAIAMLDAPDPAAGVMMQATDPPRYRAMRNCLAGKFSALSDGSQDDQIRHIVRRAIEDVPDGESWDLAETFVRLPTQVTAPLFGLPESDIAHLVKLAYSSLAPDDPRYAVGPTGNQSAAIAHIELLEYFTDRLEERRSNSTDDLVSLLMSIELDSRPLSDYAIAINCLSLLLGVAATTPHAISTTAIALAEQHGGEGRWPRSIDTRFVEEALRWSSPATHFMRRATRDVVLNGVTIREGEATAAWIASANRDSTAFSQPYEFNPTRSPNRHVTFGVGAHFCLGNNLARNILRIAFNELASAISTFEIAGSPTHLASNAIAGIVRLPIRTKRRAHHNGQ